MERSDRESYAAQCASVRKVVYEFLDEELATADVARVAQHLGACPPCAGFFNFERAYLGVLRRTSSIDAAPVELRERIRAALISRERSGPPD